MASRKPTSPKKSKPAKGASSRGSTAKNAAAKKASARSGKKGAPARATTRQHKGRIPKEPEAVEIPQYSANDPSRLKALAMARAALDKKAEHVLVIDLRGRSSVADFLVVLSANGARQVAAITDHVDETMRKTKQFPIGIEGTNEDEWVVLDFGDVVLHAFSPEKRGYFALEQLWVDAPYERIDG